MLMVAVGEVFVVADEAVRGLEGQQTPARLQHVHTVNQLATLHPYDYMRPGAGCDDRRHVAFQRIDHAEPTGDAQVLSQCQFVAQQAQITVASAQQKYTRVRTMGHMRPKLVPMAR